MHWGLEPCSSIKQGHEYKKKKEVDESSQQNSKLKKSKKKRCTEVNRKQKLCTYSEYCDGNHDTS